MSEGDNTIFVVGRAKVVGMNIPETPLQQANFTLKVTTELLVENVRFPINRLCPEFIKGSHPLNLNDSSFHQEGKNVPMLTERSRTVLKTSMMAICSDCPFFVGLDQEANGITCHGFQKKLD